MRKTIGGSRATLFANRGSDDQRSKAGHFLLLSHGTHASHPTIIIKRIFAIKGVKSEMCSNVFQKQ